MPGIPMAFAVASRVAVCWHAGYPVGCQIRQLGEALLSDNIQSQLPAFGLKPLSSLHLPPATVRLSPDTLQLPNDTSCSLTAQKACLSCGCSMGAPEAGF